MTPFRNIFLLSLAVFTVIEAGIHRPSTVIKNGGEALKDFVSRSKDDFSNLVVFINPKSGGNEVSQFCVLLSIVIFFFI